MYVDISCVLYVCIDRIVFMVSGLWFSSSQKSIATAGGGALLVLIDNHSRNDNGDQQYHPCSTNTKLACDM